MLASLRPVTPELWTSLDTRERARFLRHLRVYWDVHRHRIAPELGDRLQALLADGSLVVRAARLIALEETAEGARVTLRPRGRPELESVTVRHVVNCTGPESDPRRLAEPLFTDLRAKGLLHPDPLGLGLDTTDDGALLDAAGAPSETLYLVGPLLKGRFWEATAAPELRLHAARTAAAIAESLREAAMPA